MNLNMKQSDRDIYDDRLAYAPTHSGGFRCVFEGFDGLLTEVRDPMGPSSARSDEDQHCLERASLRKNNITVVLPQAVLRLRSTFS